MTSLKDHALFPKLLHEFTVENPSMQKTARTLATAGFTVDEMLWEIAKKAPHRFTVRRGHGSRIAAFLPDYGMHFAKLAPIGTVSTAAFVPIDHFARTNTGYWTTMSTVFVEEVTFARTFDFSDAVLMHMLKASALDAGTWSAISQIRVGELFALPLVAHLTSTVGEMACVEGERFRPFVVKTATITDVKLLML